MRLRARCMFDSDCRARKSCRHHLSSPLTLKFHRRVPYPVLYISLSRSLFLTDGRTYISRRRVPTTKNSDLRGCVKCNPGLEEEALEYVQKVEQRQAEAGQQRRRRERQESERQAEAAAAAAALAAEAQRAKAAAAERQRAKRREDEKEKERAKARAREAAAAPAQRTRSAGAASGRSDGGSARWVGTRRHGY